MQSISVIFYDGVVAKPYQAQLISVDSSQVMLRYQAAETQQTLYFNGQQMTLIPAKNDTYPIILLQNKARIELLQAQIPVWLQCKRPEKTQKNGIGQGLPRFLLFSIITVLAITALVLRWGIPLASKQIADQLPENTLNQLGDQAEAHIIQFTTASQLPAEQQQQIRRQYVQLIAQAHPAKLLFRDGGALGVNAMALPNNTIIVTDQLVEFSHSDQEILGVLAHEQGHLVQRHSLQQAISSLGLRVLYIALTGDHLSLFEQLPMALADANYSHKFEKEADQYALRLMQQQKIEVSHFANFLARLSAEPDSEQSDVQEDSNLRSSHPETAERIQMVYAFEAAQQPGSKAAAQH